MKHITWIGLVLAFTSLRAGTLYKSLEETVPWDPAAGVTVQNENGNIEIESWEADSVGVTADVEVKGSSERDAQATLDRVRVRIDKSGNRLLIKPDYPNRNHGWGLFDWLFGKKIEVSVSFLVRTPKTCPIDVESVNGEIRLTDLSGRIRARSTNGRIGGEDISGPIDAQTVNGGVDLKVKTAALKSDCRAETVNGGISLVLPETVKADIDASTVNGDVHSDFEISVTQISKNHLRGKLNGGGPRISLRTVNGGIEIGKE